MVGLADGAATQFSELAASVRFNPRGTIDVRDGSTYRADVTLAYVAGSTYHFKLDVDLAAHRYSVAVRQADGSDLSIANGYAFRTEQESVSQLDHLATEVDSASGSTDVCTLTIAPSPPPPPTCSATVAGAGFAQASIGPATGVLVLQLEATPSVEHTDAVIALSNGSPVRSDAAAVAVRFAPSGEIDARDGDTYRATTELAYHAGAPYQLRIVADLSSHTFSAFVQVSSRLTVEIAHDFAFGPSQATATRLDTLDSIVDTSDGATLQLCNVIAGGPTQLTYVRDGRPSLAMLPNDELITSDGIRTMHLDAHGTTVAQVAVGGEVAVDGAGNIAVASAVSGTLKVASFTPAFGARWQVAYPVGADETVISAGYDIAGDVMIATKSQGHVAAVHVLAPDGALRSSFAIGPPDTGASALAFTPDGFAYSYVQPGGMVIQHQRSDGELDWARSWTGDFTIYAMASDTAGDVVFTGQYFADIDFQPGVVEYHPSGEVADNTYVTLLGPDATTVFAANAGESYVRGVATNGNEVAVSGEHDVGPRVPHLFRFDRTGRLLGDLENAGLGDFGLADRTWLAASGRAYWSRSSEFPRYQQWPYYAALPAL
ncbi:MAG: hypothetical protein ABJE66_26980 [Deltaproteobacteria bacterium]